MKVTYNCGDGIVEVIVRDESGAKLDHFKANLNDIKRQGWISGMIREKYGVDLTPITFDKSGEGFFDF